MSLIRLAVVRAEVRFAFGEVLRDFGGLAAFARGLPFLAAFEAFFLARAASCFFFDGLWCRSVVIRRYSAAQGARGNAGDRKPSVLVNVNLPPSSDESCCRICLPAALGARDAGSAEGSAVVYRPRADGCGVVEQVERPGMKEWSGNALGNPDLPLAQSPRVQPGLRKFIELEHLDTPSDRDYPINSRFKMSIPN